MNAFKKSFFVIFLLFLISEPIFSAESSSKTELKGTALCSYVYSYLQKKAVHPEIQPLVSNGTNSLPYNIIVSFHPKDTKTNGNLILFFDMEECINSMDIFDDIFNELSSKSYNSLVVFGYGNRINIPRDNLIYGADVYARSLNTTTDNAAFLFSLNAEKNTIITGTGKSHSPSWMLKDLFDAYSDAKITDGLPLYFISQTEDYTFLDDKAFLAFNSAEIPCILAKIKDNSKTKDIITSCINSYEQSQFESFDSHTFMFRFFGKRVWFSELRIINAMLVILILSLIIVFYIGFINKNIRKEFWKEIRNNWYVIPVIFGLSVAGFFAGRFLYWATVLRRGANHTAFGFIIMQISISTLLVSLFFMINLSLLKKYTTRSLDFILIVITYINQFVLSLHDISLFPIFMFIFLISVVAFIFRRNWIHIILFVLLILPFIPYVNSVFRTSDTEKLNQLLIKSNWQPFVISLVLLPLYLMWLRILNAVKKRYAKKRIYALIIGSTCLILIVGLIILNRAFFGYNKNVRSSELIQTDYQGKKYDFSLNWQDKKIFSDTIRTVSLTAPSQLLPVYANLKVENKNGGTGSVLYSENEYSILDSGAADFTLPLYPPSRIEFSYGCGNFAQILTAEEIFYDSNDGTYYSIVKTIDTEGSL